MTVLPAPPTLAELASRADDRATFAANGTRSTVPRRASLLDNGPTKHAVAKAFHRGGLEAAHSALRWAAWDLTRGRARSASESFAIAAWSRRKVAADLELVVQAAEAGWLSAPPPADTVTPEQRAEIRRLQAERLEADAPPLDTDTDR